MMATAIIVFREVLEAALVIGIVLAATNGVVGRGRWVAGGIVAGLFGAALVAGFAESIAAAAAGMGQEVFNAVVLFAATSMLIWHTVWMSRHGRDIAVQMAAVGAAVREGARPLYAVAVVVAVAVLREGSEVVLFLYGIAAAGGGGAMSMLSGGLLGVVGGVALGAALYLGLLRIPTRYLFAVTTWLIVLLAAGMAAQGAGFLVQAGFLPSLGGALWDSSGLISERALTGQVMHVLVGYEARPNTVQLAFYAGTIALTVGLLFLIGRPPMRQVPANRGA
jgi:high-affinity iron transporter